jgi:hypothetical protein
MFAVLLSLEEVALLLEALYSHWIYTDLNDEALPDERLYDSLVRKLKTERDLHKEPIE